MIEEVWGDVVRWEERLDGRNGWVGMDLEGLFGNGWAKEERETEGRGNSVSWEPEYIKRIRTPRTHVFTYK